MNYVTYKLPCSVFIVAEKTQLAFLLTNVKKKKIQKGLLWLGCKEV